MSEFSFSDSAATNYDTILVPVIFSPWAESLLDRRPDWAGKTVLDLAAGTGIVSASLRDRVGDEGQVIAADINPDMLAIAEKRCATPGAETRFVVGPADALDVPDASVDVVVCQQGFQFFPDKPAAAAEILRVLRPGGAILIAVWRPAAECDAFGAICGALEDIGENETADLMRIPFDFLPTEELVGHFEAAGFADVSVEIETNELVLERGLEQAVEMAYGTPIAPMLNALSEEMQSAFKEALLTRASASFKGDTVFGTLSADVLTACKV